MRLDVQVVGLDRLKQAAEQAPGQARFAASVALNKTADMGAAAVRKEMPNVFDKPTPWVVNSLRVKRSTKANLVAEVAFKDKNSAENSRTMILPHVDAGTRRYKAMEARLYKAGYLPAGWSVVPGAAANLDAFGNMSRGQITQLLNVLGTYTEAGYNKANAKTVDRLAKGNVKKNVYGFTYWVNPVNGSRGKHLQPGVYQRVTTGFGTSLKPILIFVSKADYKNRLDFYGIVTTTVQRDFPAAFDKAFADAMSTSIFKVQGSLL